MRTLTTLSWALIAVLGASSARAQELPMPRQVESADAPAADVPLVHESPILPNGLHEPGRLSSYVAYDHLDCCGPLGGHGPINLELYFRNGIATPVTGGDVINHRIRSGWILEAGGRSLFFNTPQNAAWTVDLGLTNICNDGSHPNLRVLLRDVPVFNPNQNPFDQNDDIVLGNTLVTVRNLNRTYVNLAFGREWFYPLPGFENCAHWRWGCDMGGRWGTSNLELNDPSQNVAQAGFSNFRRITDVIGGFFCAVHADIEVPCDCGIFMAGLRTEWNYTWADWFPGLNSDFQEVNYLITLGFRF